MKESFYATELQPDQPEPSSCNSFFISEIPLDATVRLESKLQEIILGNSCEEMRKKCLRIPTTLSDICVKRNVKFKQAGAGNSSACAGLSTDYVKCK
jgi:hypothetical protein